MEYRNFSISRGKGKLYLKEKQPTQGFEEITYGEGKKTYHQYHDRIKGVPKEFGVKEVEYEGRKLRFLELSLEDGEVVNKVSVNLKNKGGYTDEVKALLSALKGLEMGEVVSLAPHRSVTTGKNGKEYENLNIYINYDDRKDESGKSPSTGYINYTDIPAPTSSIVAGDKVWDWTPQTEFYYEVLQEVEAKFNNAPATSTSAPAQKAAPAKTAPKQSGNKVPTATPEQAFEPVGQVADVHDDLPF